MGKRGPPKKPTELKVLEGNPGQKPLPENEPVYLEFEKCPGAPDFLSDGAKAVWGEAAPAVHDAKLLTHGDVEAFARFCELASTLRDLDERIARPETEPVVLSEKSGYAMKNPLYTVRTETFKDYLALAKQFGMTPAARADMGVVSKGDPDESPWKKFGGG